MIKSFLIIGGVAILYSQNLNWSQPISVTSDSSPVRGLSLIQNAPHIPLLTRENGELWLFTYYVQIPDASYI